MAEINFFVAWELWQQMTFVLAGAIVLVFLAGLVKLWWMQRFLKKHTILDEEKRARQREMRMSGIPVGRKVDIPFGVRAIQGGVEVDGIWISRPGTPTEGRSPGGASGTTLAPDSEAKGKEKTRAVAGGILKPTTTVAEVQPTPKQTPGPSPTGSSFERSSQTDVATEAEPTPVRTPILGPQSTYRPKHSSRQHSNMTPNETRHVDATGQPDTRTGRSLIETYVPTNAFSSVHSSTSSTHRAAVDRSSSSSDEGFGHSTLRYAPQSYSRTYRQRSSVDDSEPPPSNMRYMDRGEYFPSSYDPSRRNPFETPEHERTIGPNSRASSRRPLAADRPTPVRSYTGDAHANTASRRVNAGFEVLPAGTFSRSNSDADMENGQSGRNSRRFSISTNNRLQRKGRDRSSSGGQ